MQLPSFIFQTKKKLSSIILNLFCPLNSESNTWLSIHLKPIAAEHSFLAALLSHSILYTLSNVSKMVEMLCLRSFTEKISPFELILGWLFNNVSNHPLPDLCMDKMVKKCTGVHAHSFLLKQLSIKTLIYNWMLTSTRNKLWCLFDRCNTYYIFWDRGNISARFLVDLHLTSDNRFLLSVLDGKVHILV